MPKLTALTADTSPTFDDIIYTVNAPGGVPASRKVTLTDISELIIGGTRTLGGEAFEGDIGNRANSVYLSGVFGTSAAPRIDGATILMIQDHYKNTTPVTDPGEDGNPRSSIYFEGYHESGATSSYTTTYIKARNRTNSEYHVHGLNITVGYEGGRSFWTAAGEIWGAWFQVSDYNAFVEDPLNPYTVNLNYTCLELNTDNYHDSDVTKWNSGLTKNALQVVDGYWNDPVNIPYHSAGGVVVAGYKCGVGIEGFQEYGIHLATANAVATGIYTDTTLAIGIDLAHGTYTDCSIDATGTTVKLGAVYMYSDSYLTKSAGTSIFSVQQTGVSGQGVLECIGRIASTDVTGRMWASSGSLVLFGSYTNHSMCLMTNNTERVRLTTAGLMGIGTDAPTAVLHLKAGTATASTAPLKFTTGTNLTTAEAGAMEFVNDDLYFTITTAAARKGIVLNNGTSLTATRVPFSTTNGRLTDDADFTFATDTLTVTKIAATQFTGDMTLATGTDLVLATAGAGTKIGTGATQLLGFYNATPVVQPLAVADATDAPSVILRLNELLARMRTLGLIAT